MSDGGGGGYYYTDGVPFILRKNFYPMPPCQFQPIQQIQDNLATYDYNFELEHNAISNSELYLKEKQERDERHKEFLERRRKEIEIELEERKRREAESEQPILLQPQPQTEIIMSGVNVVHSTTSDGESSSYMNRVNYSEFESTAASPFDSVALACLDDRRELEKLWSNNLALSTYNPPPQVVQMLPPPPPQLPTLQIRSPPPTPVPPSNFQNFITQRYQHPHFPITAPPDSPIPNIYRNYFRK